jgi:hypothetical protein
MKDLIPFKANPLTGTPLKSLFDLNMVVIHKHQIKTAAILLPLKYRLCISAYLLIRNESPHALRGSMEYRHVGYAPP